LILGFRYWLAKAFGGGVRVSVVRMINPSRRAPDTTRAIFADRRRSSNAEMQFPLKYGRALELACRDQRDSEILEDKR
jgi:hypothetical protein